jgi:hypothetical protein
MESATGSQPLSLIELGSKASRVKLSKSLINQAKRLDRELRERWANIQNDVIRVGQILLDIKNRQLHVALGHPNFKTYVEEAVGYSKSQAFEAMRIVRELTTGPGALPPAAVAAMSQENAKHLILLKHARVRITEGVVRAAQTLTRRQFEQENQLPSRTTARPALLAHHTLSLPTDMMDKLMHAHEVACAIVRRDMPAIAVEVKTVEAKAWEAIASEFLTAHEEDYKRICEGAAGDLHLQSVDA